MKKALFEPASAARHIAHCAEEGDAISSKANAATNASSTNLFELMRINAPQPPVAAL
jgi:hypothetical protein